jgi:hypothetical protein
MTQSACLMLAQGWSGSRTAVRLGGWEQPRIKRPRKGIGWYGTIECLPATLPRGLERVHKMRKKPAGTCCPDWPCECRGDWIRTSDLLNPIQGEWRVNSSENTSLSRLAAFQAFEILQEFGHFSRVSLPNSALLCPRRDRLIRCARQSLSAGKVARTKPRGDANFGMLRVAANDRSRCCGSPLGLLEATIGDALRA